MEASILSLTDQFEGRFVFLSLSSNGLVLYWRQLEVTGEIKQCQAIYVDEIIDVFIGCSIESGKQKAVQQKVDGHIRRIFAGTFTAATCTFNSCFFTITYGSDLVNPATVTFLADSDISAKYWLIELRTLSVKLRKELTLVGAFYYWQRLFAKLKYSSLRGYITVNDIVDSLVPTKNKEDRKEIEKSLRSVKGFSDKKTISTSDISDKFIFDCYRWILERPEVTEIYNYSFDGESNVSAERFAAYLRREHYDTRLNLILHPPYNVETTCSLLKQLNNEGNTLNRNTYLRFLVSQYNISMLRDHLMLKEDMRKPLSHYFIWSSHNTYLKGYQVNSKSSVEMYRYVLLLGCRSVELDCWDGSNDEPIVTHGPSQLTRVTPVLFKDVVKAIAETAFVTSEFPVILSFENHCNLKQQKKMAAYCREIFGDLLLTEPLPDYPLKPRHPLPSPSMLRRKILVKNKKLDRRGICASFRRARTFPETEYEQRSSASTELTELGEEKDGTILLETDDMIMTANGSLSSTTVVVQSDEKCINDVMSAAETEVIANELSDLVNYMRAMGKLSSFVECEAKQMSSEMYSITETRANELVKQSPEQFVNHNKRQITRVYPKGKRVDSSNFWPIKFWNCGIQMAAINMQTPDAQYQMNSAFFEQNGCSGYVLKPNPMRKTDTKFNPFETGSFDLVVPASLSLTVISGQMLSFLCEKRPSTYVEVTFFGHFRDMSTFSKRKYRTKTVFDNGINPVYSDSLFRGEFKFEKIIFPALASIRIAVFEEGGRQLGQTYLQVRSIQPGYRHVILRNNFYRPIGPVTLFCLFRVHDYVDKNSQQLVEALQNPIAAVKKEQGLIQAASAILENPKETIKIRETMLSALEDSEPAMFVDALRNEIIGDGTDLNSSFDKSSIGGESTRDMLNGSVFPEELHLFTAEKRQQQSMKCRLKAKFYIQDMVLPFPELQDFATNKKILKMEKSFKKKNPHCIEDFGKIHESESRQLMKLNQEKRSQEVAKLTQKSVEKIEELREKYVKIGTEEQRRLNRAKEERIKELEQKFDLLKLEVSVKMENRLKELNSMMLKRYSKKIE
uniref:1-phosphatidylinositol 4,5-bisphosphate phosphodiesterase n=1 Tax=Syphacia muris TaxID=451379 RepID=A0A158R604_9BILA